MSALSAHSRNGQKRNCTVFREESFNTQRKPTPPPLPDQSILKYRSPQYTQGVKVRNQDLQMSVVFQEVMLLT